MFVFTSDGIWFPWPTLWHRCDEVEIQNNTEARNKMPWSPTMMGSPPASREGSNWNLSVLDPSIASIALWPKTPNVTPWPYVTHMNMNTPSPDRIQSRSQHFEVYFGSNRESFSRGWADFTSSPCKGLWGTDTAWPEHGSGRWCLLCFTVLPFVRNTLETTQITSPGKRKKM